MVAEQGEDLDSWEDPRAKCYQPSKVGVRGIGAGRNWLAPHRFGDAQGSHAVITMGSAGRDGGRADQSSRAKIFGL